MPDKRLERTRLNQPELADKKPQPIILTPAQKMAGYVKLTGDKVTHHPYRNTRKLEDGNYVAYVPNHGPERSEN